MIPEIHSFTVYSYGDLCVCIFLLESTSFGNSIDLKPTTCSWWTLSTTIWCPYMSTAERQTLLSAR